MTPSQGSYCWDHTVEPLPRDDPFELLLVKMHRLQFGRKSEKLDRRIAQSALLLEDLESQRSVKAPAPREPSSVPVCFHGQGSKATRSSLPELCHDKRAPTCRKRPFALQYSVNGRPGSPRSPMPCYREPPVLLSFSRSIRKMREIRGESWIRARCLPRERMLAGRDSRPMPATSLVHA